MEPKITDVAFNPLTRMDDIQRYSGTYQVRPESLAVHICDVTIMAYLISVQLTDEFGESLDRGLLLEKCVLHDLDEVITGDIPRNTKYATMEIKSAMDNLQDSVLDIVYKYIPNRNIIQLCKDAKHGKEGLILRLVDLLGVVRKVLIEIRMCGNLAFLRVVEELLDHLKYLDTLDLSEFNPKSQEWIRALIKDAQNSIMAIHIKHKTDISDFAIEENVLRATDYQKDK